MRLRRGLAAAGWCGIADFLRLWVEISRLADARFHLPRSRWAFAGFELGVGYLPPLGRAPLPVEVFAAALEPPVPVCLTGWFRTMGDLRVWSDGMSTRANLAIRPAAVKGKCWTSLQFEPPLISFGR